jgi:hypothetical protein
MTLTQYDLLLTQNTAESGGVEFEEKAILLKSGSLLTGSTATGGDPKVLHVPETNAEGRILMLKDEGGLTELSWEEPASITDLPGTDEYSFYIGGDTHGGHIHKTPASENAVSDMEFKNKAGDLIPIKVGTPSHDDHAVPKSYADGLIAANDAMVYKGTIGTGGDVTALPTTHGTGWTYRVIEAKTYAGKVCEIGDLIISLVDRSGVGNVDADWSVVQANIDGAVTGPAGAIGTETIAVWNSNNRSLKDGGEPISSLVKKADFNDTNAILGTNLQAGNPGILAAGTNTVLRRGSGSAVLGFSKIAYADITDGSPYSIIARSGSTSGSFAELAAGDNTLLGRETGNLVFGKVKTAQIDDAQISLAKMANMDEHTFIGRKSASSGVPEYLSKAETAGILNGETAPTNYDSEGVKGEIRFDANYAYFCVVGGSTGTARWKRSPVASLWSAAS